ncbi:MAG: ABC transporter permease, partial [Myxococcota bacterium]
MSLIFEEAKREFAASVRTPLFRFATVGLIGYLALILMSAQYMREMGATNIPRNSAHVVYLMTAGQAFWLIFAWAWMFARAVTRDRDALLHEIVLSAPIDLRALFVGRYLGVLGAACLLGAASPLGFLVVHPLAASGALPPDAVGPIPWTAMGWGWLLLVIPSAAGLGAMYLTSALRTKSVGGPFAVAGVLIAAWMAAMVILRGGDIDPTLATLIDPSAYGEVEAQAFDWTPAEKSNRLLDLTVPLLVNRLLWGLLPFVPLAWALRRLRREHLIIDRPRKKPRDRGVAPPPMPSLPVATLPRPSMLHALWLETRWQLARSFSGWAIWLAAGLLVVMGVAGSFVHVIGHAAGPLIPRPAILSPL